MVPSGNDFISRAAPTHPSIDQRVLADALAHPLDEWFAIIAINLAGAFVSLAVRRVGFLSTFGSII